MCGRNSVYVEKEKLENRYGASLGIDWCKNYNISPGDTQPVVKKNSPKTLKPMKWSFIPSFTNTEQEKRKWRNRSLINARIETVHEKNTFKNSFKNRKCLIPSTGFYEWKDEGKPKKTPYHIKPSNRQVFSFAGFYNEETFNILTKKAENSKIEQVHDRTPVILPSEKEDKYLDGDVTRQDLETLEASSIDVQQVSRKVNDPSYNSKDIMNLESKQSTLFD